MIGGYINRERIKQLRPSPPGQGKKRTYKKTNYRKKHRKKTLKKRKIKRR